MTDKIIVFVTCESKEQAESIAQTVVGEKLAACVNVFPGIRSCYVWKERLTWSDEVLMMIKTTRAKFDELQGRIKAVHGYDVPEFLVLPIVAGSPRYLAWLDDCLH